MNPRQRIVRRLTWAATGTGVLLGPGVDALPLLGIWVSGYVNLAKDSDFQVDEAFVKSFVGTVFTGFVGWYVSGKIAQTVVAALTAAGLTLTAATAGFGFAIAALMWLGSNALINALFTYKFLSAADHMLSDTAHVKDIVAEGAANLILQQLMDLTHLADDMKGMISLLVSGR